MNKTGIRGACAVLALALPGMAQDLSDEAHYYAVDYLTPPAGEVLEIGGMGFFEDGRMAVSTRRGQVWIIENALAEDPKDARFSLFAEGLIEGMGLHIDGDDVLVTQRGELSRLRDLDGDGRCDRIETISDGWGLTGNYHEFAFGMPQDAAGNHYVSLNVGFWDPQWWHGKSRAPWRGWVLKIDPDGQVSPFASGLRSPAGLGMNTAGDLFVTDNQGDWMPSCPIYHVQEGNFYGHPASLAWTPEYQAARLEPSDTNPPDVARANAAVWLPYKWSRSAGNLVPDVSRGAFGPFDGQMFVAELTNGMVLRTQMEKVRGEYQGAVFLFRQRIGSTYRVRFAPDGTLFCGFTNRGWGGLPPSHGLGRVRWTGVNPLEVQGVHLLQTGFELTFTEPLRGDLDLGPENIEVEQYDYDYWWEYGSPERARVTRGVHSVELSEDRRVMRFEVEDLTPAMMARVWLRGIESEGDVPLLHNEFAYAVNQLPEGPPTSSQIAKTVPPPPAREERDRGWMRLTWGDALDAWNSEGWELRNADIDPEDPKRFVISDGVGALVNSASDTPSDYVSKYEFGDVELKLQFMLPEGGESGVFLMDRYELQLAATRGSEGLDPTSCGGISAGAEGSGRAPQRNAFQSPGQWHELHVVFRAPRFDAAGKKFRDAVFEKVEIDGVPVQTEVTVPGPTHGGAPGEVSRAPLRIEGTRGLVAFGNVQAKALRSAEDHEGWLTLFDGESLDGWVCGDDGYWEVDDDGCLTATDRATFLAQELDDLDGNFDLKVRARINEGGKAGVLLHGIPIEGGAEGLGSFEGYGIRINSSHTDLERTGSLVGLSPIRVELIPADAWFDLHLESRHEPEGTRIRIWLNGVLVNDYLDPERLHRGGLLVLEHAHPGTRVQFQDLWLQRYP